MNAMEHGNKYDPDKPAQLKVFVDETAVRVTITDQGGGPPLKTATHPDLEAKLAGEQSPRGWGLFLDGIQDPGNLGTILRIADWFGISRVFSSPDCVDPFNPKVVQATMGAFLRVSCIETTIDRLYQEYPGIPIYGEVMDGENVFHTSLKGANGIIVIGNEGSGISPEAERLLSHRISIPPAAHSGAESLNAAVATGILCAVFRNRG